MPFGRKLIHDKSWLKLRHITNLRRGENPGAPRVQQRDRARKCPERVSEREVAFIDLEMSKGSSQNSVGTFA